MADIEVADDPGQHRFIIRDGGRPAGFATYSDSGQVRSFLHTEIDSDLGGRGLATALIRGALDATRAADLQVLPLCDFVRGFIAKHPGYVELVPVDHRARFELEAPDEQ